MKGVYSTRSCVRFLIEKERVTEKPRKSVSKHVCNICLVYKYLLAQKEFLLCQGGICSVRWISPAHTRVCIIYKKVVY